MPATWAAGAAGPRRSFYGLAAARPDGRSLPESQTQLGSLQHPRNSMKRAWSTSTSSRSLQVSRLGSSRARLFFFAVVFRFRQSKKRGGRSFSLGRLSEAKPLRLLRERFSAGVVSWPLARRNSQLLSALATHCLPSVNSSCSLLADCCNLSPTSLVALRAHALSPPCFRCVRFF